MKFCGVVVLYNPKNDIIDNIHSYIDYLDELYVCDNSENPNKEIIKEIEKIKKTTLISMNGNQGIALALKVGLQKAIDNQFDFCLTMDQDSKFPIVNKDYLLSYFNSENIDDFGIIGLNFMEKKDLKSRLVETNTWITSGNFINIKNYKLISGFNEKLFIDYVDFELDEQFYKIGKKVAYIEDILLDHHLGNPIIKRILFKKVRSLNHPPIRYYYRYRNIYYLYKKNKSFYRESFKIEKRNVLKVILCENEKRIKLKMIRKGKKDARKGILGKFKED